MSDEPKRARISDAEDDLLRAIDDLISVKYEAADEDVPGITTRAMVVATIQYSDGDLGTAWIPVRTSVAEASGLANHAMHEAHGAAYDSGDDEE